MPLRLSSDLNLSSLNALLISESITIFCFEICFCNESENVLFNSKGGSFLFSKFDILGDSNILNLELPFNYFLNVFNILSLFLFLILSAKLQLTL